MTNTHPASEADSTTLCKACGLCCTGHLFIWVKLRPAELDPAEALGMRVLRSEPTQRGFNQPCPLWQGQCTIYASRHYPHACRAYNCKLLKEMLARAIPLPDALTVVEQAKGLMGEMETLLAAAPNPNFRERLVARIEFGGDDADSVFRQKAEGLLVLYENIFGVKDLLEANPLV